MRSTPSRRRPGTSRLLSLALVFAVASCAASDQEAQDRTPTATAPDDACALLTQADIGAATTWSVGPGGRHDEAPDAAGSVCNWHDAATGGVVHLQLHIGEADATFAARRGDLGGRRGDREPVDVDVPGADAAFHVASEGLVGFEADGDYVQISVIGVDTDDEEHLVLATDAAAALHDVRRAGG